MCFTNLASLLSSTSIEHQYLRHLARHLFTQVKEYDAGIYVSASFYVSLEYMLRVANLALGSRTTNDGEVYPCCS